MRYAASDKFRRESHEVLMDAGKLSFPYVLGKISR